MYKKILVPLDGSTLAEKVLPHAQALAKSEDAELVLLRVPLPPSPEFFARNPGLATEIIEDTEKETQTYLEKEERVVKGSGNQVQTIMREGPVAETILQVADEIHADLIAMSTHGRTGLQRMLVGSVADKVVRLSHIPVMLIHPN
jgi:nucleotide-binding universal stress UspA family protein